MIQEKESSSVPNSADIVGVFQAMQDMAIQAIPYCIDETLFRAFLNSGNKSFPSQEEMTAFIKDGRIGSLVLFFAEIDKVTDSKAKPSANIILFLASIYSSLCSDNVSLTNGIDKVTEDKLVIFACHTIAKRWSKLGNLCSGLSLRVIHRSPDMLSALDEYGRQSKNRLMHSVAVFGATTLLSYKFSKKLLSDRDKLEELKFLFTDALGQSENRHKIYAIAWACHLLEDKEWSESGGLEGVLKIFEKDPETTANFLTTLLERS